MSPSEPLLLVLDSVKPVALPVPSQSNLPKRAPLISLAILAAILFVIATSVVLTLIRADHSVPATPSPSNPSPLSPFTALPLCRREDCGVDCPIPPLANFSQLPSIPRLPDPFLSLDGSCIRTQQQWTCRRAETSAQLQRYELGLKPPRPRSVLGFLTPTCPTCTTGTITISTGDGP